jgi:hypothetical protein
VQSPLFRSYESMKIDNSSYARPVPMLDLRTKKTEILQI